MGGDPSRVVGRRVVAYVLDTLLAVAFWFVAMEVLGVSLSPDPVDPSGWTWEGSDTSVALALSVPTIYLLLTAVVLQGLVGFTPGKLLVGIRLLTWNGRPPGLWRAFVHTAVLNLLTSIWCIGAPVVLALAALTRYHRHPGDMLANTYVVDAWAQDHLLVRTARGLQKGPPSVTRQDLVSTLGAEEAQKILSTSVVGRPTDPVYDKQRGTYVVWRPKQEQWLEFDQDTQQWRQML